MEESNFNSVLFYEQNKGLLYSEEAKKLARQKCGLEKADVFKDLGNKKTKTYSEISTYATCKFKWNLEYNELITRKVTKHYFFFGSALHDCMELIYTLKFFGRDFSLMDITDFFIFITDYEVEKAKTLYPDKTVDIEEIVFEVNKGFAIIELYLEKILPYDNFEIALRPETNEPFLETVFVNPVETPNGNKSNKYVHTGKIDGLVVLDGLFYLMEHKFLKSFNASDEEWLSKDWQILSYVYAIQKAYGINISGVIYNVCKKPALRMKKETKSRPAETPKEFQLRIVEDLKSRPEFYFNRFTVWINQSDVEKVPHFIYENCKDMANSRCLPASSFICKRTGCGYKDLCLSDNPQQTFEENYRRKNQKHEEL